MLDANADYLTQALKVKQKKYESRGIKSVRSRVTCINDHFREPMPMTMFKQLLLKQVFAGNDIEQYILNETDLAAIQKLRDEKYATWEWNYGKSPAYNMKREKIYRSAFGRPTPRKDEIYGYWFVHEWHFCGGHLSTYPL